MFAPAHLKNKVSNGNFEIIRSKLKKIKKFNAETSDYKIIFKDIPQEFVDSLFYMSEIMHLIINRLVEKTDKRDKIKITIDHPVLTERIELPFVFSTDLTSSMILNEISKIAQSNKILTLDNNISFHALKLKYKSGGGGNVKRLDNFLYKKQTIIRIKSHRENNLCAIRAIIVGKAICDNDPNFVTIQDNRNVFQNDMALSIANTLNLNINDNIGIIELSRIEKHIENYQIIVFNNELMNEIMYKGVEKEKKIYLFFHNNHFDVIRSLPAFYGKSNYCFQCMKAYETFVNHPCNMVLYEMQSKSMCQNNYCQMRNVFCEL